MKLALLLATGFEEAEAIITIDLLRRANIQVDLISTVSDVLVTSSHNVTIKSDYLIEEVILDEYHGLILPGGINGVNKLKQSTILLDAIKTFNSQKKYIFAICAAPSILIELDIIGDLPYTCYPGHEDISKAANYMNQAVVVCDHVITAEAMGMTTEFALAIINKLISKEKSEEIAQSIYYEVKNDKNTV